MTIAAGLALLLTLPCVFLVFALMRPAYAAAACMVGCVLFMPELAIFDLPVLPAFDKRSLPPLCVFLATLAMAPERLRGLKWNWIDVLLGLFALSTVVTSLYNQEPLQYGSLYIPGIGLTDTLSDLLRIVLVAVLPYYLGRAYSRNAADGEVLLGSLVMGNLLYLPFILYEMRMSPQLHRIFYGYAQHDFGQTVRAGGYRPMVFMAHGLALAMFVTAGVVAAYAIWQSGRKSGPLPAAGSALGLTALLVSFRSVGALIYGAVAVPMLTVLGARSSIQGFILKLLMVVVLAYPTLRAEGVFPTERMVAAAGGPLSDRGQSLDFRFVNEDALLLRASQKKLFGWGSYGRNRVYDEDGRDMAVTDGAWIISFGMYGYAGFLLYFGMFAASVWVATSSFTRVDARAAPLLSGLTWIVALHTIDLLPNGAFNYFNMYYTGALVGLATGMVAERRAAQRAKTSPNGVARDSKLGGRRATVV